MKKVMRWTAYYPLPLRLKLVFLLCWAAGSVHLFLRCGAGGFFGEGSICLGILLLLSLYDAVYGLLFNRLLLVFFVLAVLHCFWFTERGCLEMALGGVIGFGSLYFLRRISAGGMGCGDVKFALVLGVWLGMDGILLTLLLAFLFGGIWALGCILLGAAKVTDCVPFGPFLAAGAWLSFLYGGYLWNLSGVFGV